MVITFARSSFGASVTGVAVGGSQSSVAGGDLMPCSVVVNVLSLIVALLSWFPTAGGVGNRGEPSRRVRRRARTASAAPSESAREADRPGSSCQPFFAECPMPSPSRERPTVAAAIREAWRWLRGYLLTPPPVICSELERERS